MLQGPSDRLGQRHDEAKQGRDLTWLREAMAAALGHSQLNIARAELGKQLEGFVKWHYFVGVAVEQSYGLLLLVSPIIGVVPGPRGVFVFAAGLALVLKTSMWAKRRYVHFKRWQPKVGAWTD